MAVANAEAHAEHRPLALNQAGLWFFFLSETFLFAALLSAPFYIARSTRPEAPAGPRPRALKQAGLWFFFLSETFLLAAVLSPRFYIAGFKQPEHVNQQLGLAITTILILSSFTAYMSETSIAHGDRKGFTRYRLLTILLGLVFVAGVAVEWSTAEFRISEPYGTAFF